MNKAYRDGLTVLDACDKWYSGAFLLETVPSVIYIQQWVRGRISSVMSSQALEQFNEIMSDPLNVLSRMVSDHQPGDGVS